MNFSAAGSSDPDDPTLRYRWDFGDGTPVQESAAPTVSHTYTSDKNFTAKLTVVDTRGGVSQPATIAINVYSGELPVIELKITDALTRTLFNGGDEVTFTAMRSSIADLDTTTPWIWRVALHHNEHEHPDITDLPAASGTYAISSDNHGGATTLWYRFTLTMRTKTGQTVTVHRDLMPEYTTIPIRTTPVQSGIVMVEDVATPTPANVKAIVGTDWHFVALDELVMGREVYKFGGWLTPVASAGATPAMTVTATKPPVNQTIEYAFDRDAEQVWVTRVHK